MEEELAQAAIHLANVGAALRIGVPLIERVLGPTADYLGDELQSWTEHRLKNVARIFENASDKLDDVSSGPEGVPPRVLAHIVNEGSYCEDGVAVEYLGGVLASSRSGVSRDDRGLAVAAQISRMSTYAIRTHYVLYSCGRTPLLGRDINLGDLDHTGEEKVFLPWGEYVRGMDFAPGENSGDAASQALWQLSFENLIQNWAISNSSALQERHHRSFPDDGIVFAPTPVGIALYLWAHGRPSAWSRDDFLNPGVDFEIIEGVALAQDSCIRLGDLPPPTKEAKEEGGS